MYSAIKAFNAISKPNLQVKDLQAIHGCSKSTAIGKHKEFKKRCEESGITVLGIPTDTYIKEMGIDTKRIEKYARKEKKIND